VLHLQFNLRLALPHNQHEMASLRNLLLCLLVLDAKIQLCRSFVASRHHRARSSSFVVNSAAGRNHRHRQFVATPATTTTLSTASSPYIRTTAISEDLIQKFDKLRKGFPKDANVVAAGGWYNLERLSVDPKQELVGIITEGLKSTEYSKVQFGSTYEGHDDEKLEALLLLLYGMGKGFDSDNINGEWDLVFTRQGKKSPTFQKLVGTTEKAGRSKNFFDVASMTFSGIVKFWKWGIIGTKVKVCR
jgi:hypothetical protein